MSDGIKQFCFRHCMSCLRCMDDIVTGSYLVQSSSFGSTLGFMWK